MRDALGLIYNGQNGISMRELTTHRAVSALPVAGRYRIIDFMLSNMVNSGVRNVGIITQKNYSSLMDHLGSGKEWDLHTRNNGLFILPPFINGENGGDYTGIIDALRANFAYLRRSQQEFVVFTDPDVVYSTSYEDMLKKHIENKCDVTIMYAKVGSADMYISSGRAHKHTYLNIEDGHVTDLQISPNVPSYPNISMGALIIKRTLLIYLIDQAASQGQKDLYGDLLRPNIISGVLDVRGYEYSGFYRPVETVKGYYKLNMDLLDSANRAELFSRQPVYTKERDEVPTLYSENARVKNSLIADGCVINGTVENCVLFRGVHVGKNAYIRNSIVMQDSYCEDGVELDCVILDKEVTLHAGGRLIGQKQYPIVIGKGITL